MDIRKKLLDLVMEEYDRQSYQDPQIRQLVHDLMKDGLSRMTDAQVMSTAQRWWPEKFKKG